MSVGEQTEFEFKIKRSIFIGSVKYVETSDEANAFLTERSLLNKNATHNCYAYMVGMKNRQFYFSDDGEPSGTAGKPILGAIESTGVTNVAVIVTRYFGGIKLGVRGLIDAYAYAAKSAILKSGLYVYGLGREINIVSGYNIWNRLLYDFKFVNPREARFTDKVYASFIIPLEYFDMVEGRLRQYENIGEDISHRWGEEMTDRVEKAL